MDENKRRWLYSRDNLMTAVRSLGYPDKLGEEIVKNLGKGVKFNISQEIYG